MLEIPPDARTWTEIDLEAVRFNVRALRAAAGGTASLMAVVKADAYGHGAVPVAKAAIAAGAARLGVAEAREAAELRGAGIGVPIHVLGLLLPGEIPAAVAAGVTPTLHDLDSIAAWDRSASEAGRDIAVHVKVDTGMSRLGLAPDAAVEACRRVKASARLRLEGLCTHFASSAAEDPGSVNRQLELFAATVARLEAEGLRPPLLHASNSGAVFGHPAARFDLVRPGIALCGLDPGNAARLGVPLRPALAWRARVGLVKEYPTGTAVGYGGTFTARRPTRIALVCAGYADGYLYALSNRGRVLVRGRKAPLAGTVTMDYLLADVTDIPDAAAGDVATLVGRDGEETITADELARMAGTIGYDVTCKIGRRVRKFYAGE